MSCKNCEERANKIFANLSIGNKRNINDIYSRRVEEQVIYRKEQEARISTLKTNENGLFGVVSDQKRAISNQSSTRNKGASISLF